MAHFNLAAVCPGRFQSTQPSIKHILPKLPSKMGFFGNIQGKSDYLVDAFNFLKHNDSTSDDVTLLNQDLKKLIKMIAESKDVTDRDRKNRHLNEKRAAKIISCMASSFKDPAFAFFRSTMKTANCNKSQIRDGKFWNDFSVNLHSQFCSQAKSTNVCAYAKLIDFSNEFYDDSTVEQYKEFLEVLWSNCDFLTQEGGIETVYKLLFTKQPYLEGLADDGKSIRNTFLRQTREADDIRLLQYFFDEETRSYTTAKIEEPSFSGELFRGNTGFTRLLGHLGSKYGQGIHESLKNILTSSQLESEMVDLLNSSKLEERLRDIVDSIILDYNFNN